MEVNNQDQDNIVVFNDTVLNLSTVNCYRATVRWHTRESCETVDQKLFGLFKIGTKRVYTTIGEVLCFDRLVCHMNNDKVITIAAHEIEEFLALVPNSLRIKLEQLLTQNGYDRGNNK